MKKGIHVFLLAVLTTGVLFAQQLSTTPASRAGEKWWKSRFDANVAAAKRGPYDIVFLGDSITDFWRNRGKAEYLKYFGGYKTINMGYSADRTEHVLWRLDNGEMDGADPKLVVLMIGTNNTGHRFEKEKQEDTVDGVKAILERLAQKAPHAKVLLLAIFPRSDKPTDRMRRRNDAVNAKLANLADNQRVFWLNINDKLLTKTGTLEREIMPDLLHPSPKGYTIWAEAILPFIRKTVGEPKSSPQPSGK